MSVECEGDGWGEEAVAIGAIAVGNGPGVVTGSGMVS